ncbi:hypothetical protein vseg_014277 [Gypsophila vaccaria]
MSTENNGPKNPNNTLSNIIAPKVSPTTKLLVAENKSSKRLTKTKVNIKNLNKSDTNNNNNNNNNIDRSLKVVYISNPMKFEVNADEFQALVQGLTGRDATEWTDYNNNSYLAQEVSSVEGELDHDEVQQPLINDDQVHVDGYDGSSEIMNLDYFGPFDEDKGHMIGFEEFPSFYD